MPTPDDSKPFTLPDHPSRAPIGKPLPNAPGWQSDPREVQERSRRAEQIARDLQQEKPR